MAKLTLLKYTTVLSNFQVACDRFVMAEVNAVYDTTPPTNWRTLKILTDSCCDAYQAMEDIRKASTGKEIYDLLCALYDKQDINKLVIELNWSPDQYEFLGLTTDLFLHKL